MERKRERDGHLQEGGNTKTPEEKDLSSTEWGRVIYWKGRITYEKGKQPIEGEKKIKKGENHLLRGENHLWKDRVAFEGEKTTYGEI